jgi:DMSO/TMAO reductase YedYZ molybdopterin-dependent catalytic subunit
MVGGTAAVAVESFWRDRRLAATATAPVDLFPHTPPPDSFAPGLVRKPVTPVGTFYVMSKNTVDPALDPDRWRLKIARDGRTWREVTYRELLGRRLTLRWQTLRCISNTLKSDLMGTAEWAGIPLSELLPPRGEAGAAREVAVIGVDGHGDSFTLDYAYSAEPMLAVGMNGQTLNRNHGYPVRLLVPRYYGFKNVKWIGEIALSTEPYIGTWPKLGYTKQPVIHTCSFVDRIRREGSRLAVGGVAFAGDRGIRRVEVRAGADAPWAAAALETSLSPYCLTRWRVEIDPQRNAEFVEARAQDGTGAWQSAVERPLFPDGMAGPTLKRIPS